MPPKPLPCFTRKTSRAARLLSMKLAPGKSVLPAGVAVVAAVAVTGNGVNPPPRPLSSRGLPIHSFARCRATEYVCPYTVERGERYLEILAPWFDLFDA